MLDIGIGRNGNSELGEGIPRGHARNWRVAAKLRISHSQTLSNIAQISELTYNAEQTKKECDELKRALETQEQSARKATNQFEKLRQEHAKTLKDLGR